MPRPFRGIRTPSSCARNWRRLLVTLVLGATAALPAAAQVSPGQPKRGPILSQSAVGDLVITGAHISAFTTPPSLVAQLTVQNTGSVQVVMPTGSVLARGDAAQPGGIAFPPLVATANYAIAAGASRTISLPLDPCAAGKAGAVTFRVDPDNRVPETSESNNSFTLPAVNDFGDGDVVPTAVDLVTQHVLGGQSAHPDGIPSAYPADLWVSVSISPPDKWVLWCPGVALWRETESPLSGKYGLRELRNLGSAPIRIMVGTSILKNAFAPGDLTPGRYTWKVLLNPDGQIRETNTGNNAFTARVLVY
jgi:hypothetical protein